MERGSTASVIIASKHESNDELRTSLGYLLRQLDPKDEVIVVDPSIGERTPLICELGRQEIGISWLPDTNQGVAGARNTGIQRASKQVLIFTDADCIPASGFIDSLKQLARPDVLVQAAFWKQSINTSLDQHHLLWRKIVSQEMAKKHPALVINTRGLAIDRMTLLNRLGNQPFQANPQIHGGGDRLLGMELAKAGVDIEIHENISTVHTGDPSTLEGLLRQKYTHGKADAVRGVLASDVFSRGNFNRAVIVPAEKGVNPRLALLFWTYYVLGAFVGTQCVSEPSLLKSKSSSRSY